MPEIGFLPIHPPRTQKIYPKTSKRSSELGPLVGGSLSLKTRKSGMSTTSSALLDLIIPITSGGKPTSKTLNSVPRSTYAITIILWYVLAVTLIKTTRGSFSKYIMFPMPNWNLVLRNMKGEINDKRFEDLLMISWLLILINSMLPWEQSKLNANALVKQQKYISPTWGSVSAEVDPDEKKFIAECTLNVNLCPKCSETIPDPLCDWELISGFGWYGEN